MTIQQEIQTRIAGFAAELEELVRRAAIAAVSDALGQRPARTKQTSPRASSSATAAVAPATPTRKRRTGGKRDPKAIDALTERTASFIRANAGKRVEEIGKALNTPTKELALPIIRLLGNKTIKKTGQKRATKYFAR